MTGLAEALGPLWPYFLVIVIGFLPSEFWRICSAVLSGWINEKSEIFVWVRMVATALVAAVVIKLVVSPPEALAQVPLWARLGALLVGAGVFQLTGRNTFAGIIGGVLTLIAAAGLL